MQIRSFCSRALLVSLGSFAAILTVGLPASAETYQVGPGKPYSSLEEVADSLRAGDVVEIDGDQTYPGGIQLTQNGAAASPITIKGIRKNGKRPVLSGGTNTLEIFASHYVVEGLDITAGSFRCYFHHGDDIVMRDTIIHDCPQHGILGADSDSGSLTLEYVEVHSCGQGDTRHQIYMATDESAFPGSVFRMQHCWVHDGIGGNNVKTRAERNEIYYNLIEGAYYHELELIGPDGQDPSLAREDSDVVGNVLRKTKNTFVTRLGGDGTGDTDGRYRFAFNTIILAPGSSAVFRLFDGVESLEAHDNVFWRAGGGGVQVIQDSNVDWTNGMEVIAGSNNWVAQGSTAVPSQWTGTIEGDDPGFLDAAGLDFSPADGSPLIDAAEPAPPSPAGFAFPNPLASPAWLPPVQEIEAYGTAKPRSQAGSLDIGAFEKPGPDPEPTSSSSSTGSSTGGAGGESGEGTGASGGDGSGGAGSGAGAGSVGSGGAPANPDQHTHGADEGGGSSSGCACTNASGSGSTPASLALAALGLVLVRRRTRRPGAAR